MMHSSYELYKHMEYKRNTAEESAARGRLYKKAMANRPGIAALLLAKLSRMLMGAGERLEAHHKGKPHRDTPFAVDEKWLNGLENSSTGGIFI
ncbi:MAG: hypothetical protein MUO76_18545 [Anaerolineaceae bacterium]|nr:hypothetical protein [Anaerolineaceae bacterium]